MGRIISLDSLNHIKNLEAEISKKSTKIDSIVLKRLVNRGRLRLLEKFRVDLERMTHQIRPKL